MASCTVRATEPRTSITECTRTRKPNHHPTTHGGTMTSTAEQLTHLAERPTTDGSAHELAAGRLEAALAYTAHAATLPTTGRRTLILTASGERARSIRQTLRRNSIPVHSPDGDDPVDPPAGSITVTTHTRRHLVEGTPDLIILDLNDPGEPARAEKARRQTTGAHIIVTPPAKDEYSESRRSAQQNTAATTPDDIERRRGGARPTLRRQVRTDILP